MSAAEWGPLTLAPRQDLDPLELAENWGLALAALSALPTERLALMHQVHGNRVVEVRRARGVHRVVAEADGLWTRERDVILAVRTADCVPVLLAAPQGVACAHAGWRGVASAVVPATVLALCEGTGCRPDQIVAAIGPHISGEVYEVGQEVVQGLEAAGLSRENFLTAHPGARAHVDLGRAVWLQLAMCGVENTERISVCTFGDARMHSHRRDGSMSGRNAGLVVRCGG